jgi:16S rRNA (cytidine1402-2'-O)-methyltransferase
MEVIPMKSTKYMGGIVMSDIGKLYVCATPIGNIEDITLRVLNTLREVDVIAAEDTRHTLKLLNHFEISKPLISYHEHNKRTKGDHLIKLLREGKNIALVSDAGMPGISDPGEDIIKEAIAEDIEVTVLPGASASLTALVLSGLSTEKFVFEGFLSREKKDKEKRLKELIYEQRTLIFYEAPHRIEDTLKRMLEILGDRQIAVARELTKRYEEIIRGTISEVIGKVEEKGPRGEMVVVVEGSKEQKEITNPWDCMTIEQHIIYYMEKGMDKKEAIKEAAKDRQIPKREIYKYSIEIE